jgi:hypothetical protein
MNNDDPIGASFGSFTLKGGLICFLAQFKAKEPVREGLKPVFFLGSQIYAARKPHFRPTLIPVEPKNLSFLFFHFYFYIDDSSIEDSHFLYFVGYGSTP